MADQECNIYNERDSRPEDDESFSTRRDNYISPAPKASLISQMYQKVSDFCHDTRNKYLPRRDFEEFMSPKDGLLGMFLKEAHMPEYADDDRRREFTERTFTSLVQLIISYLTTEINSRDIHPPSERAWLVVRELADDRMAHPDHLGWKPVPTAAFDKIVSHAAHFIGVEYNHPRLNQKLFDCLSGYLLEFWNRAYEIPEKELKEGPGQRIITSLEPLNVALEDFFIYGEPERLPEVCTVIYQWLSPPLRGSRQANEYFYVVAPSIPWSECLDYLKKREGELRASGHVLDKEKADMVKMWLLKGMNRDSEAATQARRRQEQLKQQCKVIIRFFETELDLQQLIGRLEQDDPESPNLEELRRYQQQQLPQLRELLMPQFRNGFIESVEHTPPRADDQV
ncbi:hypothetical protein G7054_g7234 [Neopestalotiopsis clavispora]|nr:hypothetical protein G7054_g7234 [Neopestalotiopsis clavispora]